MLGRLGAPVRRRLADLAVGTVVGEAFGLGLLLIWPASRVEVTGFLAAALTHGDFASLAMALGGFFMVGWLVALLWCLIRPILRRVLATQRLSGIVISLSALAVTSTAAVGYFAILFGTCVDDGSLFPLLDANVQSQALADAWNVQRNWYWFAYMGGLVALDALIMWWLKNRSSRRTAARLMT
jgi:hypothetical protein